MFNRLSTWAPQILGITRILAGAIFICSGALKLFGAFGGMPPGMQIPWYIYWIAGPIEFFGGILLILGLFTRIPAAMLAVVMVVAIKSAKWGDVDSLQTLLGFEEATYFAAFMWLAIAGPGAASLDRLLVNAGDYPRTQPDAHNPLTSAKGLSA